jgi:hypothetical protein
VNPVAAGFEDDEFVAASSFAEFGDIVAGRNADGFFVDQRAALGLSGGLGCGKEKCGGEDRDENQRFPKWESVL